MAGGYRLVAASDGYDPAVALRDSRTRRTGTRNGFLRKNSLSLVCFGLFAIFVVGLLFTGFRNNNAEQRAHKQPELSLSEYATSGAFWEALTENWESEYLQMAAYVILTVFLVQKGSSESRDPDKGSQDVSRDPERADKRANVPWPVRRGGLWLKLYENSLFLVFLFLFLLSLFLHAVSGSREFSTEQEAHGEPRVSAVEYVQTSRFWFESFQNWQSEFLAVGSIVLFSVWLRQRGSPESKPVEASHTDTG
jgi:succinate dehydrogenase hydrophobic anchor subunit